jgi:group I intron endonuclease
MTNQYSEGKVYKITNTQNDEIYVGSTCRSLKVRMSKHISTSKTLKQMKLYQAFNKYGAENFEIELLQSYSNITVCELRKHEQRYIHDLNPTYNTYDAVKDIVYYKNYTKNYNQNYQAQNKDILREKKREYHEKNKETIREKQKVYHKQNKDKLKKQRQEYYIKNADVIKEKAKQYQDSCGKDMIKEKNTKYYEKNKDKVREKHKLYVEQNKAILYQKFDCACGGKYVKSTKARHERSKKHQNYINNLTNTDISQSETQEIEDETVEEQISDCDSVQSTSSSSN